MYKSKNISVTHRFCQLSALMGNSVNKQALVRYQNNHMLDSASGDSHSTGIANLCAGIVN
jgi:hypothetical protein